MNEILTNVVNKAIATLDHIKSAIIRNGVDVPEGSSTATYADKIDEVFDAGADSVAPDIEEQTMRLNDGLAGGNSDAQTMREKIYEEGKAEGYQKHFSDMLDGLKTNVNQFQNLFSGVGWNDKTFIPDRDMVVTGNIRNMFFLSRITGSLQDYFTKGGHTISFVNIVSMDSMLNYSKISGFPAVSIGNGATVNQMFGGAELLTTIEKIIISDDGSNKFNRAFDKCYSLVSVVIEGVIGQNGFNVSWSPLNKASLTSIVNALSATTTGLTVTLRLDAVNKAFETSEGAADGSTSDEWLALAATKSNWTISLINS